MLSEWQYAVLRKVNRDGIDVDLAGKYSDTTLYWLFKRGYLYTARDGVHLTDEGENALNRYARGELPLRKHVRDVTSRTARYLRVVRMRKAS